MFHTDAPQIYHRLQMKCLSGLPQMILNANQALFAMMLAMLTTVTIFLIIAIHFRQTNYCCNCQTFATCLPAIDIGSPQIPGGHCSWGKQNHDAETGNKNHRQHRFQALKSEKVIVAGFIWIVFKFKHSVTQSFCCPSNCSMAVLRVFNSHAEGFRMACPREPLKNVLSLITAMTCCFVCYLK